VSVWRLVKPYLGVLFWPLHGVIVSLWGSSTSSLLIV